MKMASTTGDFRTISADDHLERCVMLRKPVLSTLISHFIASTKSAVRL